MSDGIIGIDARPDGSTRYIEYDFWDAEWGLAKTLAPGRIWKDSIKGVYLSDMAVELKAEHMDWSEARAKEEAEKLAQGVDFEAVIQDKRPFTR